MHLKIKNYVLLIYSIPTIKKLISCVEILKNLNKYAYLVYTFKKSYILMVRDL